MDNLVVVKAYKRDVKVIRKKGSAAMRDERAEKRGKIKELSWRSRKRLAFVASNTEVKFRKMITVTYDKEWKKNGKMIKRDMKVFLKRCFRKWGRFEYLWFLEFQRRGAPHFHLLIDRDDYFDYGDVARMWNDVIGGGPEHLGAGTKVEAMRVTHAGYALKYAAKPYQKNVPEEYEDVGRFWSCSRGVIPKEIASIEISEPMLVLALGTNRASLDKVVSGYDTLYMESENLLDALGIKA